jgi:hypothetical protein
MRPQQTEPRPARVETAVDVEQTVSAALVVASRVELGDASVVFLVAYVEELVVLEAVFAA